VHRGGCDDTGGWRLFSSKVVVVGLDGRRQIEKVQQDELVDSKISGL